MKKAPEFRQQSFEIPTVSRSMLFALIALQVAAASPASDPFAFFKPSITITAEDRRQLDRGQPIARVLPGKDLEVAIFATIPVSIDGDRLIGWMRRIEQFKKSPYVVAIGRFSDPPRLDDLANLTLDDSELDDIRACKPGGCGLKLCESEMTELQQAAANGSNNWKPVVQQTFRVIMLNRVRAYLAGRPLAPYDDQKHQVWPGKQFDILLDHSPFLIDGAPQFANHLRTPAHAPFPGVESFIYWSKERLAGKAMISATEIIMWRSDDAATPDALVSGKQIFGTHYVNASLGLTAIVRGGSASQNYLAYVNRSEVDVLGGALGGLARWAMQRRLRTDAADVLQDLRRRLEQGEAPR